MLISGDKFNHKGRMRVCQSCTKVIEKLDSSDEEDGEDQVGEYSDSLDVGEPLASDAQSQHHLVPQIEVSFSASPRHSHRHIPRDDQFSDSSDFNPENFNAYSEDDDMDFPKPLTKVRKHESQSRSPSRSRNSFQRHRSGTSLSVDQGKANIMRIGQRKKSFSMSQRPNGIHIPSLASHVSIKPPMDLNAASINHAKAFIRQSLQSYGLTTNLDKWIKAFMPPLLECAANIDLDIKGGDNIDIRHYVKLKRIPGGSPSHSKYIDGIVFSQSLSFKSMPQTISNPRILLANALFENPRLHVTKLFEIARQESSRFDTIIQRVAQLQPHIILSTGYASRSVIKRLDQMGVAVVSNVKMSVINRIARYTQASISTYETLRSTTRLGNCSKFEVKTYRHHNIAKKYLFFLGTPKQLGCTIVLRGADMDVLAAVKAVVTFMVFVVFSLKLETSLLQDQFAFVPSIPTQGLISSITIGSPSKKAITEALSEPETNDEYFNDLVRYQTDSILSASPFVQFGYPYLLRVARNSEDKLVAMDEEKELEVLKSEIREMLNTDRGESNFTMLPEGHDTIRQMADFLYHQRYQHLYEMWSREKRQWELSHALSPGMFDPSTHQHIVLLYSLVSTETGTPCVSPKLQVINFYNVGDATLGQYIEEMCMTAFSSCQDKHQDGCVKVLKDHHIKYVHGNGSMYVTVTDFPCALPGMQDSILVWSTCKICNNSTPILPMSDATWKYSLGKYFEISFWSTKLSIQDDICPHDLFRDHVRFFGWHNMVVRFEYKDIELYEISVPTTQLTWDPEREMKLKVQSYRGILEKINNFYSSVMWRLNSVNIDELVLEKSDACRIRVDELLKNADDERNTLVAELNNLYVSTNPTTHLPLNGALRSVQKHVVNWDVEFADFEDNFFPSEKDITRITAQHLKRLFERPSDDEKRSQNTISNAEVSLSKKPSLESTIKDSSECEKVPDPDVALEHDSEKIEVSSQLDGLSGSTEMGTNSDSIVCDSALGTPEAPMQLSKPEQPNAEENESRKDLSDDNQADTEPASVSSSINSIKLEKKPSTVVDVESGLGDDRKGKDSVDKQESGNDLENNDLKKMILEPGSSEQDSSLFTDPGKVTSGVVKGNAITSTSIITPNTTPRRVMSFKNSPDLSVGDDQTSTTRPGTRSSSPKRDPSGRVQEVISRLLEGQKGKHERKLSHISDISLPESSPEPRSRDEPQEPIKEIVRSKSPLKPRATGIPILKPHRPHGLDRRPSHSCSPEKGSSLDHKFNMRSRIPQMKALEDGAGPSSSFTYRRTYGDNKISIPPPSLPGLGLRQRLPRELENHMIGRFGTNNPKVSVSSLAKHFEQLSKDFEKERARERRLLAQARFRAFPVAPSKPIVEVYDTVNEAVQEELHSEEGESSEDESQNNTIIRPAAPTEMPLDEDFPNKIFSTEEDDAQQRSDPETNKSTTNHESVSGNQEEAINIDSTEIQTETPIAGSQEEEITDLKDEDYGLATHSRNASSDARQPSANFPAKENPNANLNLLQALASFWADRSATGWKPLEYPL